MTTLVAPPQTETVRRVSRRTVVASTWLFVVLCYLYCDVLGFYDPEDLRAILSGTAGGIEMTDTFLLGAAVLMTIPISMVLISRVARHPFARWATVAAGAVMTLVQVGSLFVGTGVTPAYAYFSAIEITTTAFLVVYALRWRTAD
jgi:hypothetical protein